MHFKFRWLLNTVLTASFLTLTLSGAAFYFKFWFNGVTGLHEVSSLVFIAASLIHMAVNRMQLWKTLKNRWSAAACTLVALIVLLPILYRPDAKPGPEQPDLASADIPLPAPHQEGGKPLMNALNERRSTRAYQNRPLPTQTISDLMWAAFGINRKDSGRRTAPSTRNLQEIEIYAVTSDAAYRYEPKSHKLIAVLKGDRRKMTAMNNFAPTAPLVLVYVADRSKARGFSPADWTLYSSIDAGFISQNVYLFCASEGLATVVLGGVDRKALAGALMLPSGKEVVVTQPVGYPLQ